MTNNQFNLSFETELNEGLKVVTLSSIFLSEDNQAHSFIVRTTRDGKLESLSGAAIQGFFIRSDGTTIILEGRVNEEGCAVVTLNKSCYSKKGRFQLVIRSTIGEVDSTVFCCDGGVKLSSTDAVVIDENVVPSLETLLEQVDSITEALTKHSHIAPEFANNIDECTDEGKLYVLPDGYIYAYMIKTGAAFTDKIPSSIDKDGSAYNGGLGYKYGSVYTGSYGVTTGSSYSDYIMTGYIPVDFTKNKKIRISGFKRAFNSTDDNSGVPDNSEYIMFAKSDFSHYSNQRGRMRFYAASYGCTYASANVNGEDVYVYTFDIDAVKSKSSWYGGEITNNTAYVTFSLNAAYMDMERFFVTIDEEIAFATTSKWTNTGHAFTPADYEDRIIDLEETVDNHSTRIRTLEMQCADSVTSEEIPSYIQTAADEVIAKVIDRQGNRAFNMIALSDFHYGGIGDNKDNLIRACKAINYINGRINVDAIATLGDNMPFGATDDKVLNSGHRWFKEVNEILAITQQPGIVDFRTPGNHDRAGGNDSSGMPTTPIPDNAIYSYIGGYNRQCELGNVPGGWAYRDFTGHKLRVIVLNTSETEGKGRFSTYSGYHMSAAQLRWLIDALDISEKPNASDWQILVLSHHKADDYQAPATNASTNNYILSNILHAYNTGGSYTGVNAEDGASISCNFAGKNAAKLIGQIHGHHHAYIYGSLLLGSNGTATNVMAVSTPTTAFGTGEGHNDDNEGNYYNSVKNTAEETAFCLYSIDLDNHVIHAIHYGNGIDREIAY